MVICIHCFELTSIKDVFSAFPASLLFTAKVSFAFVASVHYFF